MLGTFWNWLTNAAYVSDLEVQNAFLKRQLSARDEGILYLTQRRNYFERAYADERRMTSFWFNAASNGTDAVFRSYVDSLYVKRRDEMDGMLHPAIGMAGEAGEVLDLIKKSWASGKPVNIGDLIEELGDLYHYMTMMFIALGIEPKNAIAANIAKLQKRYPAGYSDAAAIARADHAPEPAVGVAA